MKRINKLLQKIKSMFEHKVKVKKLVPKPEDWIVTELPGIDNKLVIPSSPMYIREGSLTIKIYDFLSKPEDE